MLTLSGYIFWLGTHFWGFKASDPRGHWSIEDRCFDRNRLIVFLYLGELLFKGLCLE